MSAETSFSPSFNDTEDGKKTRASFLKRKMESKPAQWVRKNIRTKVLEDGGIAKEVSTNGYGQVEFKGATRKAKAKFVQLSNDTPSETIFTLLTKIWRMEQPQLLISVTGGAKIFNMDPRLKSIFATGLRRVAQTPGTWVITGGTNTGVMKHVGEALQGATKALIGIVTWGIITKRKTLLSTVTNEPLGSNFPYTVASSLVQKGAFLDHNHTHFLLVDDGSKNKFGVEIPLRSRFEKFIMESSDKVPSVLLVLEGGPNTINVVHGACNGDTPVPVVVIKGSGRAADLLACAYDIDEELSQQKETAHEGLQRIISECFPELNTEEKRWDMYLKVCSCMQCKEFVTIFQMSGDADVDEAILSAVLKTHPTSPAKQLQLALLWNRADLAENFILNKISNWNDKDLEKAMIMALALNRVDFVKLLLNYCVSISEILSQSLLEFLYGYRSRMSRSSIRFEISDKEYSSIDNDSCYFNTLSTLCQYKNIDASLACLSYRVIQRIMRLFCSRLIAHGNEKAFEGFSSGNEYEEAIKEFDYPYRELFIWAVLNNMHEMALFLWGLEEEGMAKGIIGAELNIKLAMQAENRELPEELRKSLLDNAQDFKNIALGVLDGCFAANESNTESLLSEELTLFPGHTCLSLASLSKFEEFIAHSSVQQLLNDVWTGILKARDISARAVILAIVFPPLIFSFTFRKESQMKEMASLEFVDEDSVEEIEEDISVSPINQQSKMNGSNTQLIDSGSMLQSYNSISFEPKSSSTLDEEEELPFYVKIYEFYFKIPMVKFYTNMVAYFVFLCLFAYVAMLKKDDTSLGVAEIILTVFVVSLTIEEIHQIFQTESSSPMQMMKEHFSSIWNVIDLIAVVLFFVGLGLRLNNYLVQYGHLIYAIDSWVWILRLLHYFYAHRILGPYVLMIGKMFVDMIYFFSILVVFLVSYGVLTNAILEPQTSVRKMLENIFFHPYFNIYGELFIDRDSTPGITRFGTPTINEYAEPIAWFFLGFYLLIANVLLLNLLIAIFGNTFTEVQEKSDQIWKFGRYDLIVEYALRPSLVPPFIILEHIYLFLRWIYSKCYKCCKKSTMAQMGNIHTLVSDAERERLAEFQMEIVADYVRKKKNAEEENEVITKMDDLMTAFRELEDKMKSANKDGSTVTYF